MWLAGCHLAVASNCLSADLRPGRLDWALGQPNGCLQIHESETALMRRAALLSDDLPRVIAVTSTEPDAIDALANKVFFFVSEVLVALVPVPVLVLAQVLALAAAAAAAVVVAVTAALLWSWSRSRRRCCGRGCGSSAARGA